MTRNPIVLTVNNTLNDAIKICISNGVDSVLVVDEYGKIINIITTVDMMKAFINKVSLKTSVDKVYPKRVITINEDANIKDVLDASVGRLPVVNSEGELVGILTRTDLSKELVQKAVRESEEMKAILYSTNNGVIIINQEGVITRCNPSAVRILNLGNENILGLKIEKILPELKLHETIETGKKSYTGKIQFKDKELICDRIPLFNDEQVVAGLIVFKDSSDLKRIIDELNAVQQLSKKLDAIIESSYDGIYITDGEANTMKINKAYERITGVKREEMLGVNMTKLERSGYISESSTLRVLKTRKTTTIHQKFKTGKNALVTSVPIFDEHGKISMVVTNVRDVTELANLKEELGKNKELAEKYYCEIEEIVIFRKW
jgi:PAS domain S-box-containing protein